MYVITNAGKTFCTTKWQIFMAKISRNTVLSARWFIDFIPMLTTSSQLVRGAPAGCHAGHCSSSDANLVLITRVFTAYILQMHCVET